MNQAEHLGIDVEQLKAEAFDHPAQVSNHRHLRQKAEAYWGQLRPELDPWVTLKEASRHTHYSPESFYRWIREGHLATKKMGNRLMVDLEQVQVFIKTRRSPKPLQDWSR